MDRVAQAIAHPEHSETEENDSQAKLPSQRVRNGALHRTECQVKQSEENSLRIRAAETR